MTFKQQVYEQCRLLLEEKISALQTILNDLEAGSANDSKSSAGDKHETARAMMQLEQEKIGKQLKEVLGQRAELEKIISTHPSSQIKPGSLVKTNRGYLFFSVPLGKVAVNQASVMLLSPRSPLALKFSGLGEGAQIEFNGLSYLVEKIE